MTNPSPSRMMQEVKMSQWVPFLTEFTRENRGAHGTLRVLSPESGYHVEFEGQVFEGVSADVKDEMRTVWISFGLAPDDHLTHGVEKATVIRVLMPSSGEAGPVLEVESEDGTKTLLELSNPEDYALPAR